MLLYLPPPPRGWHGVRWVRLCYIGGWGRALLLGRVSFHIMGGGGYTNIDFRGSRIIPNNYIVNLHIFRTRDLVVLTHRATNLIDLLIHALKVLMLKINDWPNSYPIFVLPNRAVVFLCYKSLVWHHLWDNNHFYNKKYKNYKKILLSWGQSL
jgi:hypothetical protein